MSQNKEQLFDDFVHFVTQQGCGVVYTRDPRQAAPPTCGFIRVRLPGDTLFTSLGTMKFRTREEGMTACQTFAERSVEPLEWQMNFPRLSPETFASPTFAEAHARATNRWYRWKCTFRAWCPAWLVPSQTRLRQQHDVPDAG